ncbi:MAG: hypothetical protein IAE77_00580 [Prosthecobacter sp.]|jgi:hypothetical protein|uniref:hypothetical protein n=1 Tax=Prosthecobacter sp. TaxID=1965333 RepID=UPI0019E80D18|nr:hypothetical protein [Prosthecobacter sp.]MBE2281935.1 hypothetical protein [Prosthecobacter sp.]
MKTSRSSTSRQSKQDATTRPRPDIRDDLDSRSHKDDGYRGDKSKKGDRSPVKKTGQ